MFIGHHAAGFASKRFAPQVSLGTLFFAAMFLDLLWPILLLLDVEHVRIEPGNTTFTPLDFHDYPISHSLLTVIGWSVLLTVAYRAIKKSWGGAIVVGAAVLSHWVLDFITHRPDLPLWPGGPVAGLGLWNSVPGTVALESLLFATTLGLYLRTTVPRDRTGVIALWALVVFVIVIYAANLVSPPPPSVHAIAWAGMAAWLFVPWGAWIDRHRQARA